MRLFSKLACIAILISSSRVFAQAVPADKSTLSYIDVYFETDFVKDAAQYELALYSDSLHAINDQAEKTLSGKLPAFYLKDLNWNSRYFWKIKTYNNRGELSNGGSIRSFRICQKVNYITFDEIKLDIKTNKADKNSGGFISIDYAKAIIDRSGKTRWVVPELGKLQNKETQVRDLKITRENTITFLSNNLPLEIDYEGNILWQLPHPFVFEKDTITFHHDFKKMQDGHYFILGNKRVNRRLIGEYNEKQKTNKNLIYRNDTAFKRTEIAVLFEFDKNGNVVWYWDANSYITDEDLNFRKNPGGFPIFLTHANGFSVNESGTKIYLSFKELNRIIRIDKKSKMVDLSYGQKFPSGEAMFGDGLFMQQHDPNITKRNTILFFNNNEVRNKTSISSIMEIKDDPHVNDSLLRWKFKLDFDSLTKGKSNSGGNVLEMPNGNIFLCAGQLNRIFEISRNEELVWDMFLYSKRFQDSVWMPFNQYRANWLADFNSKHFLVKSENPIGLKNNKLNIDIKLYNTGTSDDTYVVRVENSEGKLLKELSSDLVKQNESAHLTFELDKQKTKLLTVISCSKSSPFIKKSMRLTFN